MIRDYLRALSPVAWAVVAACLVLVLLLGKCAIDAGRHERAARTDARTITKDSSAKEVAADERLADARANDALKEDLTNAVSPLPDSHPSDRRRALACARLRRQGTDLATVPACVGPEGGAQAPA